MKDYCADPADQLTAAAQATGGCAGRPADDTDYNANGWIDPEDLIFRFSDGVDDDGNGYIDDFVGWDTYEDDNDPFDEVQYGHGTGEAKDSTAEVNNGGDAGVCPNCLVMHMRVGDSFVADVNDFAQGVGLRHRQRRLRHPVGARHAEQLALRPGGDRLRVQPRRRAHRFRRRRVRRPPQPAVRPGARRDVQRGRRAAFRRTLLPAQSYLDFRGCTNYGAYIAAAVPANSCSSEATGRTAGMAGLIYAAARNGIAQRLRSTTTARSMAPDGVTPGRGVSAEEVDQIIATTADDMNFLTPVDYTAAPRLPRPPSATPLGGLGPVLRLRPRQRRTAWCRRSLRTGSRQKADITSPKWFEIIRPGRRPDRDQRPRGFPAQPRLRLRRALGPLVLARDQQRTRLYRQWASRSRHQGRQSQPLEGVLATIDPAAVTAAMTAVNGPLGAVDGPAADPVTGRGDHENRHLPDKFGIIVQVRVTSLDAAARR